MAWNENLGTLNIPKILKIRGVPKARPEILAVHYDIRPEIVKSGVQASKE